MKYKAKAEEISLYYFDGSGFCLEPYVPYAWQKKDETIEVPSGKSNRLNVLGFLNTTTNELKAYTFEFSVDSDTVIASIDDFINSISGNTVLVLDNASIHTSKKFKSKIPEWKKKGLEIFYLPKYSPELNLIEILWRFIKYDWLDFSAYNSWKNLVEQIENIIQCYGSKYKINFV